MYQILLFIIIFFIFYNYFNKINYIQLENLDLKNTTSIFWTGGYDSTFRLCQLLIDERKKVQPIYVICDNIDSSNFSRNSRQKEIIVMQKIRKQLFQKFPFTQSLLKPLLIVNHVKANHQADRKALYIHYQLKKFSRPYTQYERLARFSLYYPTTIEVGVDKCGTGLDKATNGFRIGRGESCRIMDNLPQKYQPLDVFKKLRFSIVHLNKKDMLNIAKKGGYDNILKNTWSCWFPTLLGNPCGKCAMCTERIL